MRGAAAPAALGGPEPGSGATEKSWRQASPASHSTNTRRTHKAAGGEMSLPNERPGNPKSQWGKQLQQQPTETAPFQSRKGIRNVYKLVNRKGQSPTSVNQVSLCESCRRVFTPLAWKLSPSCQKSSGIGWSEFRNGLQTGAPSRYVSSTILAPSRTRFPGHKWNPQRDSSVGVSQNVADGFWIVNTEWSVRVIFRTLLFEVGELGRK